MTPLCEMLTFLAESRKKLMPLPPNITFAGIEDYVVQRGHAFTSQPLTAEEEQVWWRIVDHYGRRLPIKQCFYNSMMLVLNDPAHQLVYTEGYVLGERVPLPIHHAWVTLNGKVIDPTLRIRKKRPRGRLRDRVIGVFPEPMEYLGVSFSIDQVRTFVVDTGMGGSIIDDWKRGWPLLRGEAVSAAR